MKQRFLAPHQRWNKLRFRAQHTGPAPRIRVGRQRSRSMRQYSIFMVTVAPAMIVLLILTGVPILLTPVVQSARGEAAAWGVVGPIGTLTVLLIALLAWLMSSVRRQA